jgi:hypothetical protein
MAQAFEDAIELGLKEIHFFSQSLLHRTDHALSAKPED